MLCFLCLLVAFLVLFSLIYAREDEFNVKKVEFLELVTKTPVVKANLLHARSVLESMPADNGIFSNEEDEDAFRVILHTILNHFMLSKSPEDKAEYIKMIHLGIKRGMDIAAPYANDPPLYIKTIMIKEMNLTLAFINAGRRFIAQEFIARSRKMSRALSMLYSVSTEIVPPAKLLLMVEKLTSPGASPTSPFYHANRTIFATTLLQNARLESQSAVKPIELLALSPQYVAIVDRITSTTATSANSKLIATKDISRSLDELGNIVLTAMIEAMRVDSRSSVSFEHFFDLHIIADEKQRNLFHYLCMSRSTTMLRTIMTAFMSPWEEDIAVRRMVADRLLYGLSQQMDNRQQTAISYCRMRYGRNYEEDDISGTMWLFMKTLKQEMGEEMAQRYLMNEDHVFITQLSTAVLLQVAKTLDAPTSNVNDGVKDGQEIAVEVGIDGSVHAAAVDSSNTVITAVSNDAASLTIDTDTTTTTEEVVPSNLNTSSADSGGWSTKQLELSSFPHIHTNTCDILEITNESLPFSIAFFERFINTGTPVIFRQVMDDPTKTIMSRLKEVLRRKIFLKAYGNHQVPTSTLPYGDSFGVEVNVKTLKQVAKGNSVVNLTLVHSSSNIMDAVVDSQSGEQLQAEQSGKKSNKLPMYAFGVPGNDWVKRFMSEVPIPEPLLSDKNATAPAYTVQLQYYLGAAGTGAPVHYHGPAINSLAYGEKHWVLFPPDFGFYSTIPAGKYFTMGAFADTHPQQTTQSQDDDNSDDHQRWKNGLQCTQHAGDVMFVPALWSHGTLNLQQSIGVAHEFSVESFAME